MAHPETEDALGNIRTFMETADRDSIRRLYSEIGATGFSDMMLNVGDGVLANRVLCELSPGLADRVLGFMEDDSGPDFSAATNSISGIITALDALKKPVGSRDTGKTHEADMDGHEKVMKSNKNIAWMAALYAVLRRTKSRGILEMESIVSRETGVMALYPEASGDSYHEFLCDIARLICSGCTDHAEVREYADTYIASFVKEPRSDMLFYAESTLGIIRDVILAFLRGNNPSTACEFGRHRIMHRNKLSFGEMETLIREVFSERIYGNPDDITTRLSALFCFDNDGQALSRTGDDGSCAVSSVSPIADGEGEPPQKPA